MLNQHTAPCRLRIAVGLESGNLGIAQFGEQTLDSQIGIAVALVVETVIGPVVVHTTPSGSQYGIILAAGRCLLGKALAVGGLRIDQLRPDVGRDGVAIFEGVETIVLQTIEHLPGQVLHSFDLLGDKARADEGPAAVALAGELKATLIDDGLGQRTLACNIGIDITVAAEGTVVDGFQILLSRGIVIQTCSGLCQSEVDL